MTEQFSISDVPIIKNPTDILQSYVGVESTREFMLGRLSMALEMITNIRALDQIPVADEHTKASVVAALESLIVDQGLGEIAYKVYDLLLVWRVTRFVAEPDVGQQETDAADDPDGEQPLRRRHGYAFPPAEPGSIVVPTDMLDAVLEEHRSQDADATRELEVRLVEGIGEMSNEGSKSPDPEGTS